MRTKLQKKEPMLMTLCSCCVKQFYSADCYRLKRTDKDQEIRDVCTFCGCRRGYDYYIYPKQKASYKVNRYVRLAG